MNPPTAPATEKLQESKVTLVIVSMDYHMKRARRDIKYRCQYDQRTTMIDIKVRMISRLCRDPSRPNYNLSDLLVTLVLTEIAGDSSEPQGAVGGKEKVTLIYVEDFKPIASYLNTKKVDKKKTYIRLIVREQPPQLTK